MGSDRELQLSDASTLSEEPVGGVDDRGGFLRRTAVKER